MVVRKTMSTDEQARDGFVSVLCGAEGARAVRPGGAGSEFFKDFCYTVV